MLAKRYFFPILLTFSLAFVYTSVVVADTKTPVSQKDEEKVSVSLELFAHGFEHPVHAVFDPSEDKRVFVAEQKGRVLIFEEGKIRQTPLFELEPSEIASGEGQGLLSFALHPKFGKSKNNLYILFVRQIKKSKVGTVVSQVEVDEDLQADRSSEKWLLTQEQPYSDNNGGHLLFGSDGYLYISLGDGGGGFDKAQNGQNRQTQLGSILRIDVDAGKLYQVPIDNPFRASGEGGAEVFVYGLRQPWRFHIAGDGALWVGDRGAKGYQEIHVLKSGMNAGWPITEGPTCLGMKFDCLDDRLVAPVAYYENKQGTAITAGVIYNGKAIPSLKDSFVYADYDSGNIWAAKVEDGALAKPRLLLKTKLKIISIVEDSKGELYFVTHNKGSLFRLIPE